jgi:hypothetical protein
MARSIKREVNSIETVGVFRFGLNLDTKEGKRSSLDMESGTRDAAIMPALAVVIKARIAPEAVTIKKILVARELLVN